MRRIVLCTWLAVGCLQIGCEQDERSLGRELLRRIEAVDVAQAPSVRSAQLQALESLTVHDPALAELQRNCVRAHRMLLQAEQHQARAKDMLKQHGAALERGELEDAPAAQLAADLKRSDDALKEATELFQTCQQDTRDLALRLR